MEAEGSNKLDIETIEKMFDEFDKQKIEPFEFIPHKMLPSQTVIKYGNKIYYPPDMKAGEIKVITFPEIGEDKFEIKF